MCGEESEEEMESMDSLLEAQIKQMDEKDVLPETQEEVIYHLMEEIGEFAEAVREEKEEDEIEKELADILWQVNKICWLRNISPEEIFLRKLRLNEER